MNKDINTPPFQIGQKVVALKEAFYKGKRIISKGQEFTVLGITACCTWKIDVGIPPPTQGKCICIKCKKNLGKLWWAEAHKFAPIQPNYSNISNELANDFKEVKETSDSPVKEVALS